MRLTKSLGLAGALIASALVGGTLIGAALATDAATDSDTDASADENAAAYCETFMDAFASELGVERAALLPAGQAAANAAIEAAVAAGDLTEERATAMRDRIAALDGEGCALLGGFRGGFGHDFGSGFGHGMARGLLGGDVLEAAAEALGIESADLIDQLGEADSLVALATERGVAYDELKASVMAAVQADLDAAVSEGLDQERADAIIERLTTWLDAGGQLDARGHFGPGRGGFGLGSRGDRDPDGTDACIGPTQWTAPELESSGVVPVGRSSGRCA